MARDVYNQDQEPSNSKGRISDMTTKEDTPFDSQFIALSSYKMLNKLDIKEEESDKGITDSLIAVPVSIGQSSAQADAKGNKEAKTATLDETFKEYDSDQDSGVDDSDVSDIISDLGTLSKRELLSERGSDFVSDSEISSDEPILAESKEYEGEDYKDGSGDSPEQGQSEQVAEANHTYITKVPNPIDLGTIEMKLKSNIYHSIDDFRDDVILLYQNSVDFNG
ncbi:hypothetical protein G7Y89_g7280 [Cudoniella acicularis]|uniref:Bromo domain-containing protein n=1 Tax=Cudoniella acicularis TaxID=354080 RepID=A0A8H4W3Z4_9HELO|nr:hypothetical protein G7Y89_g7280 [Cudoniella acicularis]